MLSRINYQSKKTTFVFRFILLCLTFLITNNGAAQNKVKPYIGLKIYSKNGKYGIKGSKYGKIQPEYDFLYGPGDYIFASKNGKCDIYSNFYLNLVDKGYELKDTSTFFNFAKYNDKYHACKRNNKWGWRIYNDSIALFTEYDSINQIDIEKIIAHKNGLTTLVNFKNEVLVSPGKYKTFIIDDNFFKNKNFIDIKNIVLTYNKDTLKESRYIINSNNEFELYFRPSNTYENIWVQFAKSEMVLYNNQLAEYNKRIKEKEIAESLATEKRFDYWSGLKIYNKGESIELIDRNRKIVLPAQSTIAIDIQGAIKAYISISSDYIKVEITERDGKERLRYFEDSVDLFFEPELFSKINKNSLVVYAELIAYNSLDGRYDIYHNEMITPDFNYNQTFTLAPDDCPLCNGKGYTHDGFDEVTKTMTYDHVYKDGTTTITRKNYLANERVTPDGKVYIPTTTQQYDNYKIEKVEKTTTTYTEKRKPCFVCNEKKRYTSGTIVYDKQRKEYILLNLTFPSYKKY